MNPQRSLVVSTQACRAPSSKQPSVHRPEAVPPSAVREFSGRRFVVVESDGVQQRVDVVLGIAGDGRVEIVEGLSEGQVVVAP